MEKSTVLTNLLFKFKIMRVVLRSVFRGGPSGHGQDCKIARKVSKIEAWPPPPLQVRHPGLGSKTPDIGRKMGQNLSEDLFFALHLILGEKWDEI